MHLTVPASLLIASDNTFEPNTNWAHYVSISTSWMPNITCGCLRETCRTLLKPDFSWRAVVGILPDPAQKHEHFCSQNNIHQHIANTNTLTHTVHLSTQTNMWLPMHLHKTCTQIWDTNPHICRTSNRLTYTPRSAYKHITRLFISFIHRIYYTDKHTHTVINSLWPLAIFSRITGCFSVWSTCCVCAVCGPSVSLRYSTETDPCLHAAAWKSKIESERGEGECGVSGASKHCRCDCRGENQSPSSQALWVTLEVMFSSPDVRIYMQGWGIRSDLHSATQLLLSCLGND